MMRPLPALLTTVLLAGLAACGEESEPRQPEPQASTDPTERPVPTPTEQPTEDTDPTGGLPMLITATEGGGEVDEVATRLTPRTVDTFVVELSTGLADSVRRSVASASVPTGHELYGAVVAIGCETPDDVSAQREGEQVRIIAPVPKSTVQCFAPITTVALVSVPR